MFNRICLAVAAHARKCTWFPRSCVARGCLSKSALHATRFGRAGYGHGSGGCSVLGFGHHTLYRATECPRMTAPVSKKHSAYDAKPRRLFMQATRTVARISGSGRAVLRFGSRSRGHQHQQPVTRPLFLFWACGLVQRCAAPEPAVGILSARCRRACMAHRLSAKPGDRHAPCCCLLAALFASVTRRQNRLRPL